MSTSLKKSRSKTKGQLTSSWVDDGNIRPVVDLVEGHIALSLFTVCIDLSREQKNDNLRLETSNILPYIDI